MTDSTSSASNLENSNSKNKTHQKWKGRKLLGIDTSLSYKDKQTEWRKLWIIKNNFAKGKCLDLGCGPGEYGEILKSVCGELVGLDSDMSLLKIAKSSGNYSRLINHTIDIKKPLPFDDKEFDYAWASEILEHLPSLEIVKELERITKKVILITVPNPLSPHFKEDPTHILKYSVRSLKKFFSKRSPESGFNYKVRGLGFNQIPFGLPLKKLSTLSLYMVPLLSPTITIIGKTTA